MSISPEVLQQDLASRGYPRLLPWVLTSYAALDWPWLLNNAKLRNAQNRSGYVVHLARQVAAAQGNDAVVRKLSSWEEDLEAAGLAKECALWGGHAAARAIVAEKRSPEAGGPLEYPYRPHAWAIALCGPLKDLLNLGGLDSIVLANVGG